MALNASGPISLGGCTVGQSIAKELGLSGAAAISLNCATVRSLAGIASGAIIMPTNFWGKSNSYSYSTAMFWGGSNTNGTIYNTLLRVNACGSVIGLPTSVGTGRTNMPQGSQIGATGSTAIYYGGTTTTGQTTVTNSLTRANKCGALVGSETTATVSRKASAGAPVGSYALAAYGATTAGTSTNQTTALRFNSCGAQVGSTTCIGSPGRYQGGAAKIGSNAVYAGGTYCCAGCSAYNLATTRINACGTAVGTTAGVITLVNINTAYVGGANLGNFGVYVSQYGATKVNSCGARVSQVTSTGNVYASWYTAALYKSVGGAVSASTGVYRGATAPTLQNTNTSYLRVNSCLAQVGALSNLGTSAQYSGAAGV